MANDKGGAKKPLLAALAGLFDPALRETAQKLAASVPENSPLKQKSFEAALGAVKGLVETYAEQLSPAIGVVVEKVTDLSDFFAGALGTQSGVALEKWASGVLDDAGARLKNAADPTAELERIKLELKLRKELVEIIKTEQPPAPPPIVDWPEAGKKVTATLERLNNNLDERLRILRERKRARQEGRI